MSGKRYTEEFKIEAEQMIDHAISIDNKGGGVVMNQQTLCYEKILVLLSQDQLEEQSCVLRLCSVTAVSMVCQFDCSALSSCKKIDKHCCH